MNKEIFFKLFSNKVINFEIFKQVENIHKKIYNEDVVVYKWKEFIQRPDLLTSYHYLELLKQHIEENSIISLFNAKIRNDTIFNAIQVGSLVIVKYLLEDLKIDVRNISTRYGGDMMYSAAKHGRLDIIQYLENYITKYNSKDVSWNYYKALSVAPLSGNIEVVRYLHEKIERENLNGTIYQGNTAFDSAAFAGNIEMIKWLSQHRVDDLKHSSMYHSAIRGGHIHVLEYLFDNNYRIDYMTNNFSIPPLLNTAVENNQIEILQWLHTARQYNLCTFEAMDSAAEKKNLEMVKWLHANRSEGCSPKAMDNAAMSADLEVVQWLHANRNEGCTNEIIRLAASSGSVETVAWIQENRTEWQEVVATLHSIRAIDRAAWNGHLSMVQWLHTNHAQHESATTNAIDLAALNGHIEVVKWLHTNRPNDGCTYKAMNNAVYGGHIDLVKWLHNNRTEGCSYNALSDAIQNGHLDLVIFLMNNRTECNSTPLSDAVLQCTINHKQYHIAAWFYDYIISNRMEILPNIFEKLKKVKKYGLSVNHI